MTRAALMRSAVFTFAFAAVIASTAAASAQSFYEDFASGGAPINRRFQFGFGSPSGTGPIPRTSVAYPGNFTPGFSAPSLGSFHLVILPA